MHAARRITHFTEDEYLARERVSETRHEYVNGEIFAMAGARFRHNTIAASMTFGGRLAMADIYAQVDWTEAEDEA